MWSYDDVRARDARRASPLARDDVQGGVRGPAARRRQGRDRAAARATRLSGGRRRDALLDFGDAVETLGGRYLTAEDVGIGSRDMPVMAERTRHVTGLATARGGSGDPSPFTAIGVEAAIRTVCARLFDSPSLRRPHGRGARARPRRHARRETVRARRRAARRDGLDPAKRALAERLGARWTTPARALAAKVDVLSPCALGAILSTETVPRLRCRAIAGAANNQLATEHVAELLAARGILWAPDFVVNAGGIVNIAVELRREGYDAAVARATAARSATRSRRCSTTPTRAASPRSPPPTRWPSGGCARSRALGASGSQRSHGGRSGRSTPVRQPALVGELVEVGGERHLGGDAEARGRVGPRARRAARRCCARRRRARRAARARARAGARRTRRASRPGPRRAGRGRGRSARAAARAAARGRRGSRRARPGRARRRRCPPRAPRRR